MNAGDLTELQRINDQTDVTMPGEPHPVRLERGFVAVSPTPRVAADIQNRWLLQARRSLGWAIHIGRYVESRLALVVEHLHNVIGSVQGAGDHGAQRRLLRQRPQTEHLVIFLEPTRPALGPVVRGFDRSQKIGLNPLRLALEICLDHLVARPLAIRLAVGLGEEWRGRPTEDKEQADLRPWFKDTGQETLVQAVHGPEGNAVRITTSFGKREPERLRFSPGGSAK